MLALEDVAAHVQTARAALNAAVGQREGLGFGQLLAAGDHDGHRAGRHDLFKVVAVVGLDQLHAHLGHDAGGELEEAVGALHVLAHGHHAQRGDAVAEAGVDHAAEVVDAGELSVRADEGLHGHAVGVHADGVLDIHGHDLMAQVVIEHAGAGGDAQGNGLAVFRGDAGAQRAAGAHQAVHIGHQLGNDQVQALQARGGAHEVAVVKGEHHGVAALGVEDVAQVLFHAPVQVVGALDVKAALVGERFVHMVVFRNLQSVFISHVEKPPSVSSCESVGQCGRCERLSARVRHEREEKRPEALPLP